MKKIDLGQTLNTLANVGVIAGIVFLGFELNQNNDILDSQKLAALSSLRASGYKAVLDNPDLASLLLKDRQGSALTAEEDILLTSLWISAVYDQQSAFLLDPASADPARKQIAVIYTAYPSFRRVWNGEGTGASVTRLGREIFEPDFVRFMEEALSTIK